ncbi:PQQ-dependent sugar dehydrogenase [Rossellomorea vietnamensis]|uniref:Quinoprotein glucose dehydrogenase n=1 Tax=Rossellomorea vietnamensis TaxID=218284 RepID=A0A0P6VUJ0_9BACI|nr:PQQ-dependent sugar dehydrogenase [Rossellomorea vietnamensis]KPL58184.1 quinoprotein glucose dehydrogenase [Rossellomorea vietnamensis]
MKIKMSWLVLIMSQSLLLSACSFGQPDMQQEESESVTRPSVESKVVAKGLSIPWSIQKQGDVFYITQRTGGIVEIMNGKKSVVKTSLSKPLSDRPEAGLLGLVLHPDFKSNQQAFAYYTYQDSGDNFNRVVTLRRTANEWTEEKVMLDRIPSGQYHQGGRLEIGPDQKLYITTGDATRQDHAQDLSFLGGKILRLDLYGGTPSDNPFKDSPVYSYGHRNPQGLAWNQDGELYETEHGPNGFDEVNLIQAGNNYGWPKITGDEKGESLISPLAHSGEPSWAPSGADFWKGDLVFASLAGQSVKRFEPESGEVTDLLTGFGRVRDVLVEGDTLYFVSNNTDGRGIPRENDDKLYEVDLKSVMKEE